MIRRLALSFVIVMGFLLVIAEVQRAENKQQNEFQQEQ